VSWFRVDADMTDHLKVRDLARRLPGVDPVGLVTRTWALVSRFCPTGHVVTARVTSFSEALASSISWLGWTGDPSELISGLCDSGWIDRNEDGSLDVHDWAEKQQKVASRAEKNRERQRAHRAKVKAMKSESVTRDMRDGHVVTNGHVTPLRDGTGRDGTIRDGTGEALRVADATPPGPGELFESVPPKPTPAQPLKSKPPKPPKPTDPRHAPTVKAVVEAFERARGAAYPFAPRDAAAVTSLLASLGSTEAVTDAWARALAHQGWPTVATLSQLVQHLAHFVGSSAGESGLRGTGPVRAVVTVNEGAF